jgi:V8-like Glu-specific endopeptidase
MIKRLSLLVVCTAVLAGAASIVPLAHGRGKDVAFRGYRSAARFWTPERMAAAIPDTSTGTAAHFGGVPTVGILFTLDQGMQAHYCTASVIHSPGRDLILTAAHCDIADKKESAFVPQYIKGASRQPYGIWAVSRVYTDTRWTPEGAGSDYDFAFARVKADDQGNRLEEITGANELARTPSWNNEITAIGYPGDGSDGDPGNNAIGCTSTTSRLSSDLNQLQINCGGFYTGTSGSPWIMNYNPRTGSGKVVGLIGGDGGGGPDDRISYSPVFDDAVQTLYAQAVAS